jgi:hypothetical protein
MVMQVQRVSLFDYRDGVAWDPTTNALCGGPGNPTCPGGPMAENDWNRDAIPAEKEGFDCSKGHPAMGNYHHHQNPSAFSLDLDVISEVCNLYDADGLYAINETEHSPLIGFAYDGFPIYGAYGFANEDGSGGVTRIKSGYKLRDITSRATAPDGSSVDNGPDVGATYFLGYFKEDYEFVEHPGEDDFLDEHNGRECTTPEYPDGTYAYFATVDENWNSAYPYVVGPTFYGTYSNASVNSVNETTTIYDETNSISEFNIESLDIIVFPNPTQDIIAIQINDLVSESIYVSLHDEVGKSLMSTMIKSGQTIAYFDIQTLYNGMYFIRLDNGKNTRTEKVNIIR